MRVLSCLGLCIGFGCASATEAPPSAAPTPSLRAQRPEALVQGAMRAARSGDLERALKLARAAVSADPKLEEAHLLIGSSCAQLGDLACAQEAYEQGLQALPRSSELLRERGLLRLQSGQTEAAVQDLEEAVALDPGAESQIDLGFAYLFAEQADRALALSARSVETDPACFLCWMGRGEITSRLGESQAAVEAYRKAQALEPQDMGARSGLARALFQTENFAESHGLYRALVTEDPEDGRLRVQAAQAAMAAGAPDEAVAHLEYLAGANPEDVALFQYLLQAQEAAGDTEGATATKGRLRELQND
ncbi:MAG: tetratricopeptide repeat protein [Myxococcota bacterium]